MVLLAGAAAGDGDVGFDCEGDCGAVSVNAAGGGVSERAAGDGQEDAGASGDGLGVGAAVLTAAASGVFC